MTGKTHDLIAATALNCLFLSQPLIHTSIGTVIVGVTANIIGGIAPDIDQPTSSLWNRIPAGSIIGRLICPLLGRHRLLSHSVLGILLFSFGIQYLLELAKSFLIVDTYIVWVCFMIGYVSHLFADTVTKEGVPWLFPLPIEIGIPPIRFLRLKSGGFVEKYVLFPVLLVINTSIVFWCYPKYVAFFQQYIH